MGKGYLIACNTRTLPVSCYVIEKCAFPRIVSAEKADEDVLLLSLLQSSFQLLLISEDKNSVKASEKGQNALHKQT